MSMVAVDLFQMAYPEAGAEGTASKEAALSNQVSTFGRELPGRVLGNCTPDAVWFSWTASDVDRSFPESRRVDWAEDFPSQHALLTARRLLSKTDQILNEPISVSDIEAFQGDLILHWRAANRGAALVFPADGHRLPKLYREQVEDDLACETRLVSDPQPSDVSSFIRWVRLNA